VIFKAGADRALLKEITDGGTRLVFEGGPQYRVKPGESLQIRAPSLQVFGDQFSPLEVEKIEVTRKAGISRYFLSYVQSQSDVDRFLELVGRDAEVCLKIENQKGLLFVQNNFKKLENLQLVAARGDLYVEIDRPHKIAEALQLIITKDPEACVGSRVMLSVIHDPVPSCADFLELAWLYDVGYRKVLLCDELCLREELLARAVNACGEFFNSYSRRVPVTNKSNTSIWRKLVRW
jgi:pyruvate kinase